MGCICFRFHFERNTALGYCFAAGAVEVFVNREQRVRLQFTEGLAELLFDPVQLMEKCAAFQVQLPAAELPIGSQQEVISEDAVLTFVQSPLANQAEIGGKFLVL